METKSLWPKMEVDKRELPFSILKKQSDLLSDLTNGCLCGEIVSANKKDFSSSLREYQTTSTFDYRVYSFYILANELSDYRYLLLTLEHNVLEIYPAKIKSEIGGIDRVVYSEEELLEVLSLVLGNSVTKEIIETLVLQSREICF